MKRNPLTYSNHFGGSSKRRRIDPGSAGSHQPSRLGFIDQRLIEGSQWRGHPDLVQRATSPIQTSTSSCHDEDTQLDAFGKYNSLRRPASANMAPDLELLAHQKSNSMFHSSNAEFSQSTPREETLAGDCKPLPIRPRSTVQALCS